MGAVAESMRGKLTEALSPTRLEIVDDSARHAGHAGARAGGESHFTVTIQSAAFAGIGRLQRQRLVHAALAEALAGPVHALSLKALGPGED
ncbi:MAG: BolA family transcriptional regulator [Pseudomonadota bacterium]|nr:BolA family transcriptional regulator [Pseudomonadota bacterium]